MRFASKFLDREPFSNINRRIFAQRAREMQSRAAEMLQKRLVNTDRLMYDVDAGKILDEQTKKLFTGKFLVPADKFERIVHVKDGQEISSLVRLKNGGNYYAEMMNGGARKFKVDMSPEEVELQTQKMLEADQQSYDKMIDAFVNKK